MVRLMKAKGVPAAQVRVRERPILPNFFATRDAMIRWGRVGVGGFLPCCCWMQSAVAIPALLLLDAERLAGLWLMPVARSCHTRCQTDEHHSWSAAGHLHVTVRGAGPGQCAAASTQAARPVERCSGLQLSLPSLTPGAASTCRASCTKA